MIPLYLPNGLAPSADYTWPLYVAGALIILWLLVGDDA